MSLTDFIWVIAWFFAGLITFQFTGIKKILNTLSTIISILSLFVLFLKPDPLTATFNSIGLGYISGIFTTLSYRIGANISRCMQFGEISPKIVLYVILFLGLWIMLEALI